MSKEDPVHHRNLLPSDSVLGEAAPIMHWRTCSVIEWSSPIHWWWNTWTQTFHSCPPPLSKSNPPLLLKIFPIACTEIQTGISAFFYWKHLFMFPFIISTTGHEKPLSQLSPAFCHPASLKSMYGHVECTINAIFKDFTFFPYLYNVFM